MNNKLKVLTAGVLFFTGQAFLAQETANDSLSQEKKIEEVVIVGFGRQQSVKEVTGSLSTIKSSAIEDVPVASVDKLLQGRTTGVQLGNTSGQPGSSTIVRVRGISSINGVTDPVYIVDGVRVSSGELTSSATTSNVLATINPDDIESITVLKDAVSTAVYGADAGAGVIVITTKQGKRGKPRFRLNFSQGFSERAVKGHRGLTATEYKQYISDMFANGGYDLTSLETATATGLSESAYNDVMSVLNSPYDTNWRRETERKTAYMRNVDASMSGGSSKINYYLGAGYFEQEGIARNTDFKRLSFTSKVDYKATERLKIGSNIQVSYSKTGTVPDEGSFENPLFAQYNARPTDPVRNADGTYYLGEKTSTTGMSFLSNGIFNVPFLLEKNRLKAETAKIFGNFSVDYQILKNLNYRLVFAPEYINIEEERYLTPLHGSGAALNGYLSARTRRYFSFNVQNILSYKFNLGYHNFDFSAIQEAYRTQARTLNATGTQVGNENLYTLSNFVLMHDMAGTKSRSSRHGYALTGHYDYDKLVLLDLSYRRDNMSSFARGSKGGNFWSAGLAVDLARLNFLKDINAISQLKFKTSYGKVGNQVSANPFATYSYSTNYNNYAAANYDGIYNPNLSWETVNPFNIGIDFGFFNDRVRLGAEYYNKKTKDLIYDEPLSRSQGLSSNTKNIGSLVNKGVELYLNTDIFRGGRDAFNWSLGFNLSTLKNEITELYGGDVVGNLVITREGESLRTFYMRKWAGVDVETGNPLWYVNGVDGETTSDYNKAQRAVQGSVMSKYFGGLNSNFSYKGFGLDLQFTYAFGGMMYDEYSGDFYSDGKNTFDYVGYAAQMDYWTPENPYAPNPKPVYRNSSRSSEVSTRYLYKTDYIRLSSARLSYTFRGEQLRGSGLSSVQLYLMGTNLLTWAMDKNLKFDPEVGAYGYSKLAVPIMRTYSLGVNINF